MIVILPYYALKITDNACFYLCGGTSLLCSLLALWLLWYVACFKSRLIWVAHCVGILLDVAMQLNCIDIAHLINLY